MANLLLSSRGAASWRWLGTTALLAVAATGWGSRGLAGRTGAGGSEPAACATLVSDVCAHFGRGSEACATMQKRASRLAADHCAYLLEAYDQTVAELSGMHDALRQLADPRQGADRAPVVSFGPTDARVTIVQFSDFDCPECARIAPMVRTVRDLGGDREPVRFVLRQFPTSVRGRMAAEAALAANAQGKFLEFHDALFAAPLDLGRAVLEGCAARAGLDVREFRRALDDHRFAAAVDADVELGRRALISGAPAMFVNGRRAAIPEGVTELAQEIAAAAGARSRTTAAIAYVPAAR
jgi:protein-disulfide isomerase